MVTNDIQPGGLFGVMAEFATPESLIEATRTAHAAGFREMDAYAPFPVEGLFPAMGRRHTWMPQIVLGGGLFGCIGGYALCYYMTIVAYAHNVGGRPMHSWPAYIPIMFECTVLAASLAAVIGMLAVNGLPMPYYPTFNAPQFLRASQDSFFLCIFAADPKFDLAAVKSFLENLNPVGVTEVEE